MKFGLFYELSVPKPWEHESSFRVYQDALEQIKLADELGFDQVWAVEHHFLEEFSHCSAPEVFLAAAAAQTKKIRVGHGIVPLLPPMNHPARVAERAAVLDLISGGRLEFGTGRASTWTEVAGYRIDPDDTKAMWDEGLKAIPQMWMNDMFSFEGKYFSMPPRNVLPKPLQKPHPPLWVAVSSPETAIQAAERGIGLLGISFGTPGQQKARLEEYRKIIRDCEPVGAFVNDQVNTLSWMYCHEDDEHGFQTASKLMMDFNYLSLHTVTPRQAYPSASYSAGGAFETYHRAPSSMDEGPKLQRNGAAVGNPEQIIKNIKAWEEVGIDRLMFFVAYGNRLPQHDVIRSMKAFARDVMPKFKEPEPKAEPEKQPAAASR